MVDIRVHIDTLEYTRDGLKTPKPISLQTGEHNRIVLVRPERARPSSAGMGGFAVDSCFPTPASLAIFLSLSLGDALVDLFNGLFEKDPEPDTRVFQLYGHADRTGDEARNKSLGEDRAEAMRAILVRDIDAFVALGEREGWGLAEQQVMLRTLKCDPGPIDGQPGSLTEMATTDFQSDYVAGVFHRHTDLAPRDPSLEVDGDLGGATYKALLEALVMGCSPGVSPDALHPTLGMIRLAGHSESGDNAKHNERDEEETDKTEPHAGVQGERRRTGDAGRHDDRGGGQGLGSQRQEPLRVGREREA